MITIIYLGIGTYLCFHIFETKYEILTDKDVNLRIIQIADSHVGTTFDGDGFIKEIEKISEEIRGLKDMSKDILENLKTLSNSSELQKQAINEVLFDIIDKQCDRYINELHGIPASEVKWFSDRCRIYVENDGNHGLKVKIDYCLNKLPIIPD